MGSHITLASRMMTLLQTGNAGAAWRAVRHRFHSNSFTYGLRRDLTVPFTPPPASVPLTVRPLQDGDIAALLDVSAPGMAGEEINTCLNRLQMLEAKIPTCYVAVTDGKPCYMQWVIGPAQNATIQSYFKGSFPLLKPDEVLLESAFTPIAWRGLRIMPSAMAQIAEQGASMGARWAITFVGEDNIASLKGCKRAGFAPYLARKAQWRLLRRQVRFEPLPTGTLYPFERAPAAGTA